MKGIYNSNIFINCPFEEAILKTRNWLNNTVSRTIPGGDSIYSRYQTFQKNLPDLCKALNVKTNEVLYKDYCKFIKTWLKEINLKIED